MGTCGTSNCYACTGDGSSSTACLAATGCKWDSGNSKCLPKACDGTDFNCVACTTGSDAVGKCDHTSVADYCKWDSTCKFNGCTDWTSSLCTSHDAT